MDLMEKMKDLIKRLNEASDAYYNTGNAIMTDKEFDRLLAELSFLEQESGVILSNSPTQSVGAPVLTKLNKIIHEHKPMLSLGKVHSAEEVFKFANGKELIAMIKLDGLSVRLTYEDGKLIRGETRGNGVEGSDITDHVKQFENVPLSINKMGTYVVDGEAIITDKDFEAINAALPEGVDKFKNSRNLASGTLALLDTALVKERHLQFVLWDVIKGSMAKKMLDRLTEALELGFDIVPYVSSLNQHAITVDVEEINISNDYMFKVAKDEGYPIDGVVWRMNDIAYGETLGQTSHHFCNAVAFKFSDDVYETTLRDIEWSMGKTGILTPVAIFNPVEIDGTEVERASLHNLSVMEQLYNDSAWYEGLQVFVYKANQIIPQISAAIGDPHDYYNSRLLLPPTTCPICGSKTEIKKDNSTEVLICTNENCQGKLLGKLSHAVSKNALNIEGLSESTLDFLINEAGWVKSLRDLFKLEPHKSEWAKHPGFGKKSVMKLFDQLEEKRNTTFERFLYAQSIPLIGRTASKQISKFCNGDIDEFCKIMSDGNTKMFLTIDGFGDTMCDSLVDWMNNYWIEFLALKQEFNFITETKQNKKSDIDLSGATFCITGKLVHFANRDELVADIENHNGKFVSSVTSKTNYLINNDKNSTSSKNTKAKQVGCNVISEQDYLKMIGEN